MSLKGKKYFKYVAELTEGEIISEPILSSSGQVLVYAGTTVTKPLIEKLIDWRIFEVTLVNPDEPEAPPAPKETEQKQEAIQKINTFNSAYDEALQELEQAYTGFTASGNFPIQEIRDLSHKVLAMGLSNTGLLERLALIPRSEPFIYGHVLHVSILSVAIGRWMGLSVEELRALALGAIIHDIGRCYLPPELFSKYRQLTDEDRTAIEAHTVKGFRVAETLAYTNPAVKFIVLQHHEQIDGSGYPMQLKGDKIHLLARIVAFADRFDLMTFESVKQRRSVYQVIELMMKEGYTTLCTKTSDTFFRHCKDLLLGGAVKLSDGTMGRVVYIHPQHPTRPVIQVGPEFFIDLSEDRELYIESILNEYTDVVKPIGSIVGL